ncbi:HalOD1 output domain-containing protein [Halalkalicoccus sp. NIPERK01]|uniref:HalOD1 output domain-containing protein n=1 Tax=Halalkalicoccus sp. NIPERK01 TaxID=3053469 RepID=UPI00256EF427|nr:HalOD1 output domain-containing protein [Halalkalicoccus sp. NIPERK01]MDL5363284.1 hypothetical protein [Halalkalicoccus sp. NIPERK01]
MATDPRPTPTHEPRTEPTDAFRYSMSSDETACEAVCNAVATVEGCSVLDLEPIAETVDTDSLDALFSPANRDERYHLTLRYAGYEVAITGDEVSVLSVS